MPSCDACFRNCKLQEGQTGVCGARVCRNGKIEAQNYGIITSEAVDSIEKKPFKRFFPGSQIFSLGSYGCNLFCPFCQNFEISRAKNSENGGLEIKISDRTFSIPQKSISPEEAVVKAKNLVQMGNIGIAFTYNEPLVGYEYVRDTAKLCRKHGLKTVLVTNGAFTLQVLREVLPYIDAMNIDLKGFTEAWYSGTLMGNLPMVKEFINAASQECHVEITTLVIPGKNDSEQEMRRLASWIAGLHEGRGAEIPLHISRYYPHYRMLDIPSTPVSKIYKLVSIARKYLNWVYCGNC